MSARDEFMYDVVADGVNMAAGEHRRMCDRIDTLTAEVAPWRELKSAMNRNELNHEDAYYAVERAAREEGKQ